MQSAGLVSVHLIWQDWKGQLWTSSQTLLKVHYATFFTGLNTESTVDARNSSLQELTCSQGAHCPSRSLTVQEHWAINQNNYLQKLHSAPLTVLIQRICVSSLCGYLLVFKFWPFWQSACWHSTDKYSCWNVNIFTETLWYDMSAWCGPKEQQQKKHSITPKYPKMWYKSLKCVFSACDCNRYLFKLKEKAASWSV